MIGIAYALVGTLAAISLIILNTNFWFSRELTEENKAYRAYQVVVLLFFCVDIFWGVAYAIAPNTIGFHATEFFHLGLTLTVFWCCRYVLIFQKLHTRLYHILYALTVGFTIIQVSLLVANNITPICFDFDTEGEYVTNYGRNLSMLVLVTFFVLISAISLVLQLRSENKDRKRMTTIMWFSVTLTVAMIFQILWPLLPMFSVGLILSSLIIRVFIHDEEQREQLETLSIVSSLSRSYLCIYFVDFTNYTFSAVMRSPKDNIEKIIGESGDGREKARQFALKLVAEKYKQATLDFCDLPEVPERLRKANSVSFRFLGVSGLWCEGSFVVAKRDIHGECTHALFCVRNIDDVVETERALKSSQAESEAKTRFLQNMGHDIRTPLNAILGFSQLLSMPDGTCTPQEKEEYANYIMNSYELLNMLINDVLDVADTGYGNYRLEMAVTQVNEMCRTALKMVTMRCPAGVEMMFTTDCDDDFTVNSDSRRIQQILVNYLTNACKHTTKGSIVLDCSHKVRPGRLTFTVTDTGCGVPPEQAENIFGRGKKLNQNVQGSGLGLNICQTLADKLGGEVFLDTTYKGGARFVFVM